MSDGLPFPIRDPALLDESAKDSRRRNLRRVPKPGDLRCHAPNVSPARVHYWPDSSSTDQKIAREYSSDWGFIVAPTTVFSVIDVAYDNLGNAWCLVLCGGTDGRMGYVKHLVTVEDFEREAPRFRQNWSWPR